MTRSPEEMAGLKQAMKEDQKRRGLDGPMACWLCGDEEKGAAEGSDYCQECIDKMGMDEHL